MTFSNFGALLGGLGLFLLATSMITDGLRLAAGDALLQNALGSAGNAQSLHQTLDTLRNLHRMFELFSKATGRIDSRLPAALPEADEEAVAPA